MNRTIITPVLFLLLLLFFTSVKADSLNDADSLYIRAIDYYDESEDSSTVIEITYPKVYGLNDQQIEDNINAVLEDEFLKSIEWYHEFIAVLDSFPTMEYTAGMFFSFETGFDIKLLNEKILSLVLNHYEFTGGAHGNYYSIGYTFDLQSGELLTLESVISKESIPFITRLCEAKILEIYEASSLTEAGMFEDHIEINSEQDFFLLEDALIFQFDPYEIAPYVMGNIEVEIPFDEISEFLLIKIPFDN